MNKQNNKNYIPVILLFTAIVVAVLIVLVFIPDFKIGNLGIRRANILSEIYTPQDDSSKILTSKIDTSYMSQDSVLNLAAYNHSDSLKTNYSDSLKDSSSEKSNRDSIAKKTIQRDSVLRLALPDSVLVPIEDFSADGLGLKRFFRRVDEREQMSRPVRVVFLGDSFIEGDIFTVDIRERLQDLFGGNGVGYMPMQSQVAAMRGSIKHSTSGEMRTLSLINAKNKDSMLINTFPLFGKVFIPKEGAEVSFSGVKYRRHLKHFSTARLLFINQDSTKIDSVINDTIERSFIPPSDNKIQQIIVSENIKDIKFKFTNVSGFVCYGAYLEDCHGISIDNHSLRGSSGIQLLASNVSVNRELNDISQCDLVVLQYGLNVMSEEQQNYDSYAQKMKSAVNLVKRSCPEADILIMGVPDRNVRKDGKFVTMSTIQSMISAQRRVAQDTETLFWNTFQAMGGENSMSEFVARGWGAKDYTHINYRGGRYIAKAFINALLWEKQSKYTSVQSDSVRVDTLLENQNDTSK